jgi:hypothetical protein
MFMAGLGSRTQWHSATALCFEIHAFEVHAFEVHAFEVHAFEVHAFEVHAFEVHAFEVHAFEDHAFEVPATSNVTAESCDTNAWKPLQVPMYSNSNAVPASHPTSQRRRLNAVQK